MKIRPHTVTYRGATPRERWAAFYRVYRMVSRDKPADTDGMQALYVILHDTSETRRMLHCVNARDYSWIDLPLGSMLRRIRFKHWRDPEGAGRKLMEALQEI